MQIIADRPEAPSAIRSDLGAIFISLCFDIFSPPPGDSDVISQVERLSSKGLWVGGPVPLGYRCIDKKLEIVPEEAEAVRTIFALYLELGSIGALLAELDRRAIRTKVNHRRNGQKSGGIRFGVGSLAHLLKNRFYVGEVIYRGEVHRGEHDPILTRDLFEAVQAKRATNAVTRQVTLRGSVALLAGRPL